MATKIKSIRLPEELDNEIKQVSDRYNLAEMDIIRMALTAGLTSVETALSSLRPKDGQTPENKGTEA